MDFMEKGPIDPSTYQNQKILALFGLKFKCLLKPFNCFAYDSKLKN